MQLKYSLKLCLLLCFMLCFLAACDLVPGISVGSTATAPSTSSTPDGSGTPQLNAWSKLATGVEIRYEHWKSQANNEDTVTIVRFDVRHIHLSVEYQPAEPLSMSEWKQKEPGAALIINGGYFDQGDNATGLVVSNGQASGTSYSGFGGMLSVDNQGHISLRSLIQHPYDPNEQLQQATQSSPMLVLAGKPTQFNANAASSRRSVVATDKQGHLLFIVSPEMAFSLGELQDLLVGSDLAIDTALNLDGGASTGLYVKMGKQDKTIDSFTNLPIVVVIRP